MECGRITYAVVRLEGDVEVQLEEEGDVLYIINRHHLIDGRKMQNGSEEINDNYKGITKGTLC